MSVQTEIDRISTAVQNAHLKVIEKGGTSAAPYLVANLADAIDTIPAGEDVTAETTEYTELLTDLEAAVDSLPEAGSDSSGGVETCTVNINALDGGYITGYAYTSFENGEMTARATSMTSSDAMVSSAILENVVCNSALSVSFAGISFLGVATTNTERIGYMGSIDNAYYKAPPNAGDVATIEAYDND